MFRVVETKKVCRRLLEQVKLVSTRICTKNKYEISMNHVPLAWFNRQAMQSDDGDFAKKGQIGRKAIPIA